MNLAGALLRPAATTPDAVALLGPDGPMTYDALARQVASTAADLEPRVQPGDRVGLIAENEPAFVVSYLAILTTGAVAVPLNPASPSRELGEELNAVTPVLVVASASQQDLARRAVEHASASAPVLVVDTAATAAADPPVVPLDRLEPVARMPEDLAVLLFTAGTAGAPRPAMLTHGSLLSNLEQMQAHPGLRIRSDDVALGVLPFFHVFGLNVVLGLSLFAGASVSLVEHFHPGESLAQVRANGVTVVAAVPAVFAAWLTLDDSTAPADALALVRLCVSGATALPRDVADAMHARFGVAVCEGYGLTEASPVVSTSAVERDPRPGSIGPPLPGVEVRLVDASGDDVLAGDPGEIRVRGANVFAGYWNDAEATARVLTDDGWLQTGDIAVADADGWLTLVDRAKDVIIVSGFNVYPGEVEAALASHHDVADVAVVGEPHPRTGETVAAYVVAREGATPDPVELIRHAGRRLARYKLPTRVELVASLPRAFGGKLARRALSSSASDSDTTGADAGRRWPDATVKPA